MSLLNGLRLQDGFDLLLIEENDLDFNKHIIYWQYSIMSQLSFFITYLLYQRMLALFII